MEENKKSKKIVWIISAIIILILGIISFVLYDKANSSKDKTTTTKTIENNTNRKVFANYPIKNDDNILSFDLEELWNKDNVDLTTNFKDLKLKKENIDYTLNCADFDNVCWRYEIFINNVRLLDENPMEGYKHSKYIIINEDYLLVQHNSGFIAGCGHIEIFKNGELIYTIKGISTYINNSYNNFMKYKNNKLYYFIQTKEGNKSYNVLKTIDFNTNEIIEKELERQEIENATCYEYSCEY